MLPEYSTQLPPNLPLPLLPRLSLEATLSRNGMFDGAWWPRSRDIHAELPSLITALKFHLGPISRVGLDTEAWDGVPRYLMVDGLVVHVGWFSASDHTISVTRGLQDHFLLLVVPPFFTPTAAAAAMAAASRTGNSVTAIQLLARAQLA